MLHRADGLRLPAIQQVSCCLMSLINEPLSRLLFSAPKTDTVVGICKSPKKIWHIFLHEDDHLHGSVRKLMIGSVVDS